MPGPAKFKENRLVGKVQTRPDHVDSGRSTTELQIVIVDSVGCRVVGGIGNGRCGRLRIRNERWSNTQQEILATGSVTLLRQGSRPDVICNRQHALATSSGVVKPPE